MVYRRADGGGGGAVLSDGDCEEGTELGGEEF